MPSSKRNAYRRRRFGKECNHAFVPAPGGGWMCTSVCSVVLTDEEYAALVAA